MLDLPQLAVVPLKPFSEAKLRLSGALSDQHRQNLAHRMASHVIRTALEVVPTLVVSRDHDVLRFAESLGAYPLPETPRPGLQVGDLNDALSEAADFAGAGGTKAMVVIAGDLPLLAAEDVEMLLRFPGRPGLVIAPDASRVGTNALALTPPDASPFRFGPDSLRRHRRGAYLAHIPVRTLVRFGLERDVDTPQDLDWVDDHGALGTYDFTYTSELPPPEAEPEREAMPGPSTSAGDARLGPLGKPLRRWAKDAG